MPLTPTSKKGTPPLLRWAGSKRQLLDELKFYWPPTAKRYVEPFCGSACLFFNVAPKHAVLGDINGDLVGTYRAIRTNPTNVWRQYRAIRATKIEYYRVRRKSPSELKPTARAARFLFLNRYCFNGLYRTNKQGHFNVPYGGCKQPSLYPSSLLAASKLLRRAKFISGDFENTLSEVKAGDFVYLDPPYALESRRIFSEYDKNGFSVRDLDRLCDELRRISASGAWFLLSYADTQATRVLFKEWFTRRIVTRRNIAGFAGHRKKSHELLVANFPLPKP